MRVALRERGSEKKTTRVCEREREKGGERKWVRQIEEERRRGKRESMIVHRER